MSDDVGAVAETLIREDGLQKLALVGFSMGGNLVLKLLGEWGAQAPLQIKAGIGVSPAMDLAASADALHDRVNRIYEWRFLLGLKQAHPAEGGAVSWALRHPLPARAFAACATSTIR